MKFMRSAGHEKSTLQSVEIGAAQNPRTSVAYGLYPEIAEGVDPTAPEMSMTLMGGRL